MRVIKKYFKLVILFLLVALIFEVIYINSPSGNCVAEKEFKSKKINGYITRKFYDTASHLYPTIELSKNHSQFVIHDYDNSGFYSYVKPGDSILKKIGSLKIIVYRNSKDTFFNIDYNCD